jgi:regulatory protein
MSPPGNTRVWTSESAFAKVVRLCSIRERTVYELEQRLHRDGIPDELAATAIKRAFECRLIDELRFAEAFLRGKLAAGWGQYRIEKELAHRGVDPLRLAERLQGYPQDYFCKESELERAMAELGRCRASTRNIQDARYRRLMRKGFAEEIIEEALIAYAER